MERLGSFDLKESRSRGLAFESHHEVLRDDLHRLKEPRLLVMDDTNGNAAEAFRPPRPPRLRPNWAPLDGSGIDGSQALVREHLAKSRRALEDLAVIYRQRETVAIDLDHTRAL